MKRIAFVIYRQWAFDICTQIIVFQKLYPSFEVVLLITTPEHEFTLSEAKGYTKVKKVLGRDNDAIYQLLVKNKIDAALFYGWSWIVKKPILDEFLCLVLHPSKLPRYRGGTPIQHQILNGEKESAVSVIKMDEGIDSGDIYMQIPMSLSGDINDIFKRMTKLGVAITKRFILDLCGNKLRFRSQQGVDMYPPLKRRKPEDSEITKEFLNAASYKDIHNLVRGLLDPFPNAYFIVGDQKILIQKIVKRRIVSSNVTILNEIAELSEGVLSSGQQICLRVKDSYAKIPRYKIERIIK